MNKRIAIGIAIMAMAATAVQALTYDAAGSGIWSTTATWGTGTPGATGTGDLTRVGGSYTVTLNSSVPYAIGNLQIGNTTAGNLIINSGANLGIVADKTFTVGSSAVGTLVMNGGTVTGKTFSVANGANTAGSSATIHGGTINFSGELTLARFFNASLTMDGGSVLFNKLSVGDVTNTTVGTVSLTGGTMELGSGGLAINTAVGSHLTMGGNAQLILAGDQYSLINGYVTTSELLWANGGTIAGVGDHTWANGGDYLHSAYDSGANKTTVWVNTIPEPATVGMLGLGSLIVLLVRRMRG